MKNIAIKNDNVGKKPLTLSSNIHNFIKILKSFIKILFIRKPLEKIWGFVYTLYIIFIFSFIDEKSHIIFVKNMTKVIKSN